MDQNIVRGIATISLSGTAYTGTLSVADTVYVTGAKYLITASNNSIEGATLNLNSIGAVNLVKLGNVRINTDDLTSGRTYEVIYNGTNFVVQGLPNVITAYYIHATHGGAVSTISLTSSIPANIDLDLSKALIQVLTQPGSAGLALIEFGNTGGTNAINGLIDVKRPFNDPNSYSRDTLVNWSFAAKNVPYGTFTIASGAGGSIDTVAVGGINLLSAPVAYSSSLTVTAKNVAKNINANPNNIYKAANSGAVVYLYLDSLDKYDFDAFTLAVSATATTMTVGTFQNIGFSGTANTTGYFASGHKPGAAFTLAITISGADLTGGVLRLTVPYYVEQ